MLVNSLCDGLLTQEVRRLRRVWLICCHGERNDTAKPETAKMWRACGWMGWVFFGVLGAQQLANGEQIPSAHQTEPLLSCGGTLQVEDVLLLRTAAKGRVEGPLWTFSALDEKYTCTMVVKNWAQLCFPEKKNPSVMFGSECAQC